MNYEEILRAYNTAIARGANRDEAAAELRRLTGMTPAQVQARIQGGGGASRNGAAAAAPLAPAGIDYHSRSQEASDARGAVVQAYFRAKRAGADEQQLRAEVRRLTGMTPEQMMNLEGRINLRHTMRLAWQGLTLGFGDELAGAAAAIVPGGQDYTQARDASRANLAAARRYMTPVGSAIIEGVGSAALPLVGADAVGTRVLAGTGSRVLAGTAAGATGGGIAGAVSGAGNADGNAGDRLRGAAAGGAVGAVTGGALGATGAVATRATGRLAGRTTSRATDQAARVVRRELQTAGVPVEEVPGRLAELGPGSVPADLGENLGRQARAAVNNAPELAAPGGPVARIRARTADTRARVAGALRTASGLPQTYEDSLAASEDAIQQVRQQYYRPLEAQFPEVQGTRVRTAIQEDPRIGQALRGVRGRLARPPAENAPPSFTELQDVKKVLEDDASQAMISGRRNEAREARAALETLVQAMSEDIPGFADAQAAYRTAISRFDAHELGRSMASRPPSDIRRAMAGLPAEAQDAFRQGLLDTVETRLLRREGASAGDWIDAGQTTRELGRTISGSEDQFGQLMNTLTGREQAWRGTSQALTGNSTTAQQLSDADALIADIPTSASGLLSKLVDYAVGPNTRDRAAAAAMIGRTLLAEGPEAAQRLAQLLRLRRVGSGLFGSVGGTMLGTAAGQAQMPNGGDPNALNQLQQTPPGLLQQ